MLPYCLVFRACIKAAAVGVSEEMRTSSDSHLAVIVWLFIAAILFLDNGIVFVLTRFLNDNTVPAWCSPVLKIMWYSWLVRWEDELAECASLSCASLRKKRLNSAIEKRVSSFCVIPCLFFVTIPHHAHLCQDRFTLLFSGNLGQRKKSYIPYLVTKNAPLVGEGEWSCWPHSILLSCHLLQLVFWNF